MIMPSPFPNLGFFGFSSDRPMNQVIIRSADARIDLDNLRFNTAPATAVPEPASWALMIGGFGIAGGAMRRRSARYKAVSHTA